MELVTPVASSYGSPSTYHPGYFSPQSQPSPPPGPPPYGPDPFSVPAKCCASEELAFDETWSLDASKQQRNIIILDWDDTIFPSTWLHLVSRSAVNPDNMEPQEPFSSVGEVCLNTLTQTRLTKDQEKAMDRIETSALSLLWECQKLGRIYIVTNAESGWVQLSSSTFMPGVFSFLAENKVPIISARACFSNMMKSKCTTYATDTLRNHMPRSGKPSKKSLLHIPTPNTF
eukprot:Blabericola_migrator_1__9639@NODE_526_length_7839_cov_99_241251_g402_i0_p5_GENE_NODE_526_length_7839_cov_99_241251_g402_i0NODE_526_length_7839_cov_99_241251_g402_i0_p5_ORF_typecomplete_len230_score34_36_NODE_526_length_7839_cov_99_241251_g402_i015202209